MSLHWDVFVTPSIPIVARDKPPGDRETFFQATASTLIYGGRDAVLVDAFMTVKQATALADWVAARGRNLTTIYITHGHGDHWFGVGTLLEGNVIDLEGHELVAVDLGHTDTDYTTCLGAQLSRHTSGRKTKTIQGSSNRPDNTFAISTD